MTADGTPDCILNRVNSSPVQLPQVHLPFSYNPADLHCLLSTLNPRIPNIPTVGAMVKIMHKMELLPLRPAS